MKPQSPQSAQSAQTTQNPATPVELEATAQDLQPKHDVKGGILIGLLVPAVQKVRLGTGGS